MAYSVISFLIHLVSSAIIWWVIGYCKKICLHTYNVYMHEVYMHEAWHKQVSSNMSWPLKKNTAWPIRRDLFSKCSNVGTHGGTFETEPIHNCSVCYILFYENLSMEVVIYTSLIWANFVRKSEVTYPFIMKCRSIIYSYQLQMHFYAFVLIRQRTGFLVTGTQWQSNCDLLINTQTHMMMMMIIIIITITYNNNY